MTAEALKYFEDFLEESFEGALTKELRLSEAEKEHLMKLLPKAHLQLIALELNLDHENLDHENLEHENHYDEKKWYRVSLEQEKARY